MNSWSHKNDRFFFLKSQRSWFWIFNRCWKHARALIWNGFSFFGDLVHTRNCQQFEGSTFEWVIHNFPIPVDVALVAHLPFHFVSKLCHVVKTERESERKVGCLRFWISKHVRELHHELILVKPVRNLRHYAPKFGLMGRSHLKNRLQALIVQFCLQKQNYYRLEILAGKFELILAAFFW